MIGGQVLVAVAKVILAKLAGGVTQRLEQFGDGGILGLKTDVHTRHTDLGQARAIGALAGDEGGSAGCTTLLTVRIGETHAFVGDAVDVGGTIAHQTIAVATQIGDADVIAPDDQDVGFFFSHFSFTFFLSVGATSLGRPKIEDSLAITSSRRVWRMAVTVHMFRASFRAMGGCFQPWHCPNLRPLPQGRDP